MPGQEATKRPKLEGPVDSEGFRPPTVEVTDEMFEAARLMKTGVAHIKDLDYGVLKEQAEETANKLEQGPCSVILIDPTNMHTKTSSKPLTPAMKFDFNSDELFCPDQDSIKVSKSCWDWLVNPYSFD